MYLDRLASSVGGSSCCGAGYGVFKAHVCFGLPPVLAFLSAFHPGCANAMKYVATLFPARILPVVQDCVGLRLSVLLKSFDCIFNHRSVH